MRQSKLFTAVITLALLGVMIVGCGPNSATFPDENLEAAIRAALDKPVGEEITTSELAGLTKLEAEDSGIADLSGLEYCTSLTDLTLDGNQVSDISPLGNLTNLAGLFLDGNQISDLSPLASLTSLTDLTNLTSLILGGNQISDISPLVENTELGTGDEVWLEDNNLDLTAGSDDMENIRVLEDRGVLIHCE